MNRRHIKETKMKKQLTSQMNADKIPNVVGDNTIEYGEVSKWS